MILGEVKARVEEIAQLHGDDEAQHGKEDSLWKDVLQAIVSAKTLKEAKQLAHEALKTKDLEFQRWCA